jgi:hypothetical protein
MNLPLIFSCIVIIFLLIFFPLIVSYKAESKKTEWEKIKIYGNKINSKLKKKNKKIN